MTESAPSPAPLPIVLGERFARVVTPQLALLVAIPSWALQGWMAGVPLSLLGCVAVWRAWRAGLVLDDTGLTERAFLPGSDRTWSWDALQGVSLDEVIDGPRDARTKRLRLKFSVTEGDAPQLIGVREEPANQMLAAFQARGRHATDVRTWES